MATQTATTTAADEIQLKAQKRRKTLLGHVPVDSPFYIFHPVTRLHLFLFLGIIPLFIFIPEINIALLIINIILMIWGRVDLSSLRIYVPLFFTVALFMFGVVILAPGKDPTFTPVDLGFLTIYFQPFFFTFAAYWRLIAMLFGTILYFSTNRERDMLIAMRTLRLPFAASYVVGLSIRAAGMFMEDFKIIREAEQARGLDTKAMKLSDQVKLYMMYLIPLFSIALRRADEISHALFARGYTISGRVRGGGKRRDYIRSQYEVKTRDIVAIALMIIVFVGVGVAQMGWGVFEIPNSPLHQYLSGLLGIA